ncbi:MAG: hypothetical protein WC712_14195 [Candidatus Brocadiia bacterium]
MNADGNLSYVDRNEMKLPESPMMAGSLAKRTECAFKRKLGLTP